MSVLRKNWENWENANAMLTNEDLKLKISKSKKTRTSFGLILLRSAFLNSIFVEEMEELFSIFLIWLVVL